jgi:hypothetical protein
MNSVTLILYVLLNVPINTHKELHQQSPWSMLHSIHVAHLQKKVRDMIGPAGFRQTVDYDASLRQYTYIFEGQATHKGTPCADARVVIHLVTSRGSFIQEAKTTEDGTYSIEMVVEGSRYEPVDWSMEAFTSDFKKVEMVGRRIVMREDDTVTVHNPFEFTVRESVIPG